MKFVSCRIVLVAFYLLVSFFGYAQKTIVVGGTTTAPFSKGVNINTRINEIAYQKKLIGSVYLNDNWQNTNIYLSEDSLKLENITCRFDLRNNVVEIKTLKDTLILPTYRIEKIVNIADNREFVTERYVKSQSKSFYQVVINNQNSLLKGFKLKIVPADFNVITNTGSKDDEIIKKEVFYIYRSDKLIKIASSKGQFKKQFFKNRKLDKFFDTHKIRPKEESFLIDFVNFINKNDVEV